MSSIGFQKIMENINATIPENLANAERIPDLDLMWQTALVTLQKERQPSDDGEKLVGLNRFFEFDAGTHQPIFKTVKVNYEKIRFDLLNYLAPCRPAYKAIRELIDNLKWTTKPREGQFNLLRGDGTLCTSWAVEGGHLSTIVLTQNWDLWRNTVHDVVEISMLHYVIAALVGVKPGPISFVCNRITIHADDKPDISNSTQRFREFVQVHADVDMISNTVQIVNSDPAEMQPGETEPAYRARLIKHEMAKEEAEKTLKSAEASDTFCTMIDVLNAYFNLQLYDMSGIAPEMDCIDALQHLGVPKSVATENAVSIC